MPPKLPRTLGLAGLLPQLLCVFLLLNGDPAQRFTALALAYAYAALILSFLGGLWWGLAAASAERAPAWLWVMAVVPSLVALATAWPWAVGLPWPEPSLLVLGAALIAALAVDRALVARGLAPSWWWSLRLPLSLGLGGMTLLAGVL